MKFIHFGCWNNIDCTKDKERNYRDVVLDYIRNNEKDYAFIIVSGDNWYSNKIDQYKYYFTNVLQSGLVKLYNLNKPSYIILGNHDEDASETKEGCMLNTERYYVNKINQETANILVPSLEYLYDNIEMDSKPRDIVRMKLYEAKNQPEGQKIGDSLFIFINTNIFMHKEDKHTILHEYINGIEDMIKNNRSQHYFIVGHVPITSLNANDEKTVIHHHEEIISKMIDTLSPYRPVYLCADTHNFQVSTINKEILQVVVGTGGADPNILPDMQNIWKNKVSHDLYEKKYNVDGYYQNSYGYSIITVYENNPNFVSVEYNRLLEVGDIEEIVNKKYTYIYEKRGTKYEEFSIKEENLNGDLKMENAKLVASQICQGLSEDNVVKSDQLKENLNNNTVKEKNLYCYQKGPKTKSVV